MRSYCLAVLTKKKDEKCTGTFLKSKNVINPSVMILINKKTEEGNNYDDEKKKKKN